jgi:hypothetical protein
MLVNIPAPWSIWVIFSDTIFAGRKLGSLKNTMNSSIISPSLAEQQRIKPRFFFGVGVQKISPVSVW